MKKSLRRVTAEGPETFVDSWLMRTSRRVRLQSSAMQFPLGRESRCYASLSSLVPVAIPAGLWIALLHDVHPRMSSRAAQCEEDQPKLIS